jgi:hypothetical protein
LREAEHRYRHELLGDEERLVLFDRIKRREIPDKEKSSERA